MAQEISWAAGKIGKKSILCEAVRCAAEQTLPPKEIVVVDASADAGENGRWTLWTTWIPKRSTCEVVSILSITSIPSIPIGSDCRI